MFIWIDFEDGIIITFNLSPIFKSLNFLLEEDNIFSGLTGLVFRNVLFRNVCQYQLYWSYQLQHIEKERLNCSLTVWFSLFSWVLSIHDFMELHISLSLRLVWIVVHKIIILFLVHNLNEKPDNYLYWYWQIVFSNSV